MNHSVLVVDDEPLVLAITAKLLQRLGYEVTSCSSAEQALSLCQSNRNSFHLLLSDVNMPQKNGFELAQCLLGHHPDLRVLFMSGARYINEGQKAIMELIRSHNWQVLAKPFSKETLRIAVEQALSENRLPFGCSGSSTETA